MKLLFLSTINLACNPRLYKEIMLARQAGHDVEVICFEFNNWSYQFNKELLQSISDCRVHLIQGNRKPFLPWAWSVCKEKSYRMIAKLFPLKDKMLSQAVTRRSDLLINEVKKLKGPYDLVIGHNPGALYPAFYAAKKFGCKAAFDVEDYHPGEGADKHVQHLNKKLMNAFLPEMDYVTFAAPLMKERHARDIGREGKEWNVILNLFLKEQFSFVPPAPDKALQLVWFSQNVNYQRGLEQFIPALAQFGGRVHLTLIGNKKEPFYSEVVAGNENVSYLEPMEQDQLNQLICSFDVGLAIEPGKDHNNIIALSNKLITYFQSGLYILASDTPAHKRFFEEHGEHGMAVSLQAEDVPARIAGLLERKSQILSDKQKRFNAAAQMHWNSEAEKLLQVWERVVGEG